MQVIIYGPNLRSGAHMHVHRAGCKDTRKPLYRGSDGGRTIEATSCQEVVFDIYPPDNFLYDADTEWEHYSGDISFFPCCTDGPDGLLWAARAADVAETTAVEAVMPGQDMLTHGQWVTVLRRPLVAVENDGPLVGRALLRVWCRAANREEGYVDYGPGAYVQTRQGRTDGDD